MLIELKRKKNIVLMLIELFLLGTTYMVLKKKDGELAYVVHMAVSVVFFTMLSLPDFERVLHRPKRSYIVTAILSVLFCLMFSLSELLVGLGSIRYSLIFMIIFVSSAIYLVNYGYFYVFDLTITPNERNNDSKLNKEFAVCLIAIAIISFLMIFSTDVGVFAEGDVLEVFDMARGIDPWREWHTVGYGLWCKLLITLFGESLGSIIKANNILWFLINFFVLLYLKNEKKNGKAIVIYTVASILVYSPYYYNLVGYKDNVFSVGFLGMTLYFLYLVTSKDNKVHALVFGCFAMSLVLSTRHGGFVPLLIGVCGNIIFSIVSKDRRKMIFVVIPAIFAIVVSQVINFVGHNILMAEENPEYIAFTTPLYMVSAMASEGVEFEENDKIILEQIATMEEWSSFYNKYWLDDVARDYGKIGPEKIEQIDFLMKNEGLKGKLIVTNWHLATHHPIKYVRCLLDASSLVWEISRPIDGYEWSLPSEKRDGIKYKSSFLITSSFCDLTKNIPLWNSISWRGGVALFVIISLMLLVVDRKKWKLLSVFAPITIWEVMFLISCYAQDSRYVLPAIEVATLLAIVIPMECKSENV